MPLELYGSRSCPYTAEMRAQLEWDGIEFIEYDVEHDATSLQRLAQITQGSTSVPVLVEDGHVSMIGWQGRTCFVAGGTCHP
jgi:glutaredoxin 3